MNQLPKTLDYKRIYNHELTGDSNDNVSEIMFLQKNYQQYFFIFQKIV